MMQKIQISKRVMRNICQLILGGVMLSLSYNYVQANDAEKTNFISGITVLKQKVHVFLAGFMGHDTATDASHQQQMLRNYKELSSYLEKANCTISIPLADIHERIQLLMTMSPEDYKMQSLSYGSFASQVYEEMQQRCKK